MNSSVYKSLVFVSLAVCFFSLSIEAQTAKHTVSETERAILNEINEARKDPKRYIVYLEDYRKIFRDKTAYYPNGGMIVTKEGLAAIDDAINFLKVVSPAPELELSGGLAQTSNFQLKNLMENSSLGHFGKDGSKLPERLLKFGTAGNVVAENITYFAPTPREIILTMIIDDGTPTRGHRKAVFNQSFRQIGVSFAKGKGREQLCVAVFADSFRDLPLMPAGVRRF